MGTVVSVLGVYLSLKIDLPTGATIVCTFGLVLLVMGLLRGVVKQVLGKATLESSVRASR